MPTKLRAGGRADAQNEPLALRSILLVCGVQLGGSGCGEQAYRQGTPELRYVRVRLLPRRAVRYRVADVFRPRLVRNTERNHWAVRPPSLTPVFYTGRV